jgi:hypothetical protein
MMSVGVGTNSDCNHLQDKENQTILASDLKGNREGEYFHPNEGGVGIHEQSEDDDSSFELKEVFDVQGFDRVLAKKMALVNKAIDEIGMTSTQWKMFFLNGFGYAVDSVSRFIEQSHYIILTSNDI